MSGFLTPLEGLASEGSELLPSTEALENGLSGAEQLVLNPEREFENAFGKRTNDQPDASMDGNASGSPASKLLAKFFGTDPSFLGKLVAGLILGLIGLVLIFTSLEKKTVSTVVNVGKKALEAGALE